MPSRGKITELLLAWGQGDETALDRLIPLVFSEIRRLAHGYMRGERADHTLQTSALINEAYLRLIDSRRVGWQDRAHFLAVWAQLMRRVLVDFARSRTSQKRGGNVVKAPLAEAISLTDLKNVDVIRVDHALQHLAALDSRKAQVIELRFFGGLSVKETAEAVGVCEDTVARDWRLGRVWLMRELGKTQ